MSAACDSEFTRSLTQLRPQGPRRLGRQPLPHAQQVPGGGGPGEDPLQPPPAPLGLSACPVLTFPPWGSHCGNGEPLSWPALTLGEMHTVGPLFPDKVNPSCHQMLEDNGRGRGWHSERTGTLVHTLLPRLCAQTHTAPGQSQAPVPQQKPSPGILSHHLLVVPRRTADGPVLRAPLVLAGHC